MVALVIAGCAVEETPNDMATETTVSAAVGEPESEAGEAESTVPPETTTTTTTTTTTLPELETRCVTILKCQFAFLEGVDYSLLKLEFTDFSVAQLSGASFLRANLKQSTFIRADLSNVNMTGADLTSANLTGAVVSGTDFTNANMTNTIICGVDLEVAIGISEKQLKDVQTFRDRGNRYCP